MIILFYCLFGFILAVFLLTVFVGAPYVPSRRSELAAMFNAFTQLPRKGAFLDIGSGDGIVLRVARDCGFERAMGYEINPFLVVLSKFLLRRDSGASVCIKNFWTSKFPDDTSVVYVFGESRDIKGIYEKTQRESTRLQRSIWMISYGFEVPGVKTHSKHKAYVLYQISPLQSQ